MVYRATAMVFAKHSEREVEILTKAS